MWLSLNLTHYLLGGRKKETNTGDVGKVDRERVGETLLQSLGYRLEFTPSEVPPNSISQAKGVP